MKYTKEQRLDIGRRIYYSEISRYEAAEEYGISEQTARNYMRMYRDVNRLPPKHGQRSIGALSFKKREESGKRETPYSKRVGIPTCGMGEIIFLGGDE